MKAALKPLILASTFGVIGVTTIAGANLASAETKANGSGTNPESSLVEKISSTFNLDKSKVQALFDQEHSERKAKMEQHRSEKLQKLVDAGTITAAQKTAIEAKLDSLKAERKADRAAADTMTSEERKAKMEEMRKELEAWAKEQGLDLSLLKGVFGGPGGHGGPKGPGAHQE